MLLIAATMTLAAQSTDPQKVVAEINGETITAADLDRMYAKLAPRMREAYDASGGKMQFLQQYVGKRLIVQQAVKENFHRRADVARDLEDARESALMDLYVRNVVADEVISEIDLQNYYEMNPMEFMQPEMIRARHILIMTGARPGSPALSDAEALETITHIFQTIRTKKATFEDMARQNSHDSSASEGGDLGWFGRGQMVPEFEVMAFSLEKNEVSSVIRTDFGYHIIRLDDRRDAERKPYREVRHQIRERLLQEHAEKILAELNLLTNQLRAASRVNIYPNHINE
jgi:peptidyl-prolyl cis-trans isomerase C